MCVDHCLFFFPFELDGCFLTFLNFDYILIFFSSVILVFFFLINMVVAVIIMVCSAVPNKMKPICVAVFVLRAALTLFLKEGEISL